MKQLFTFFVMLAYVATTQAQLTVDPAFNPSDHGGGKHNGTFGGDWSVDHALILPNGKILTGGFYGFMHNQSNNGVSLLNADGSIDTSFHAPGINDNLEDGITAIALQADGKILLGGYMAVYHSKNVYHLLRINPNGDLDTSFHTGTGFNHAYQEVPFCFALQPNGKIIVGGNFTEYNGVTVNGLIRINEDGSLDNSFNFSTDSVTTINKVIVKADGKLIVGGFFKMHTDNSYKNLVRLNSDGSLDKSFNANNNIVVNRITALDVQKDNKIVFACDTSVYRINADGSIDNSFTKGIASNAFIDGSASRIADIKIQPDGKILLAGGITGYNNSSVKNIFRLNTNGSIDNSFSTGTGFGASSYGGNADGKVETISLFNDGRIFLTGRFLFYRGVWQGTIVELNSDGSINNAFNADNGNGADASVNKIAVQPDNKILIAGYFDAFNSVKRNKISRLNPDGTLDNSFNPGTGPDSCNFINTVALQKDGKIFAGGNFSHFNNAAKSYIVRLNKNGSLDNSFSFTAFTKTYGNVGDGVRAIAVQNDGKIIIGFETEKNYITGQYNHTLVLRLNTDGSVDNNFNASALNTNPYGEIYAIKIQNDNKIIVIGDFSINGSNKKNLIRLNNDGSMDVTFNNGGIGPNGRIYTAGIQSDGKIVIGGNFSSYNNSSTNIMARLNVDGSLDASYAPILPNVDNNINYISSPFLIIDDNNKVLFSYLYFADTIYSRILRYNIDGSIDNSFGIDNRADFMVNDMALQNEKLLLGGFIESFNSVKHNHITRIITPEILPVKLLSFTAQKQNNSALLQWQTTNEINNSYFDVERSPNSKIFSSIGTKQGLNNDGINNYSFTDNTPLKGINYYRLKQTDKDGKFSYSGIASVEFLNDGVFTVSPNPAGNFIKVFIPSSKSVSEIIIYDVSGKKILHEQIAANITSKQINISTLTAGVYNVVLIQNSKKEMMKLVKK